MILIKERGDPRKGAKTKAGWEFTRVFLVEGVYSQQEAIEAQGGPDTLPEIGDDYQDKGAEVDRIEADQLPDDPSRWEVKVTYKPKAYQTESSAAIGNSTFSFNVASERRHITQAQTATPAGKSFAASGTAPLSKGLIGWDGTKVQGADVSMGIFKFSVAMKYAKDEFTAARMKNLSKKCYFVNSEAWSLWDAGEIMLENISGSHVEGAVATVSNDPTRQFRRLEKLTGIKSTNTANGKLYLTLVKYVGLGNYRVEFFKDADRTQKVAECAMAKIGTNNVASVNGSGISGSFDLSKYTADSDEIYATYPMPWDVKYDFAVSPNEVSRVVGDITVTNKRGWEYLDVRYGPTELTVGSDKYTVMAAKYAYCHEVLGYFDFGDLLINPNTDIPIRE